VLLPGDLPLLLLLPEQHGLLLVGSLIAVIGRFVRCDDRPRGFGLLHGAPSGSQPLVQYPQFSGERFHLARQIVQLAPLLISRLPLVADNRKLLAQLLASTFRRRDLFGQPFNRLAQTG